MERYRGYVLLSLAYAAILGGVLLWRQPPPTTIRIAEATPRPSPTPALLVIHVAGAVLRPGVYALDEHSRVNDAIEAAGGLAPNADEAALNLAAPLHDGQRISIPALGEPLPPDAPSAAAAPPASPSGGAKSLVNLNTASAAELDALPGIGAVLAQRIIDDRQANGPYASVDDLARVRGIGPVLLEDLRPLVTVR